MEENNSIISCEWRDKDKLTAFRTSLICGWSAEEGNDLIQATEAAFRENTAISAKVGQIIREIAAASREQAEGIAQISMSVAEMKKMIQQVAATAQKSASMSEVMTGQTVKMREVMERMSLPAFGEKNFHPVE